MSVRTPAPAVAARHVQRRVAVVSTIPLHREALALTCRQWSGCGDLTAHGSAADPVIGMDLIVADLALTDLDDRLNRWRPRGRVGPKIVIWGGYPRVERVRDLRERGVRGFLSALTHVAEMHRALDAICGGTEVFPHLGVEGPQVALGGRELEVAWRYAVTLPGRPRAEVAQALGISENTVKVHLGRVRAKLGGQASTRIQLRRTLLSLYPDGPTR